MPAFTKSGYPTYKQVVLKPKKKSRSSLSKSQGGSSQSHSQPYTGTSSKSSSSAPKMPQTEHEAPQFIPMDEDLFLDREQVEDVEQKVRHKCLLD